MDVDSGGTEKDAEDENFTRPPGRHKRTVIDVAKKGVKLIVELANSLWRSLRGRAESRTRCSYDVQSQQFWLSIVVSLILCAHKASLVF